MIRGLYTAASGMMTSMLANDTLANNVSNSDTAGFKKNRVSFQSFPEMMIQKMSANGNQKIGSISTGSRVRESLIDFTPGSLHQTGNTFDMAIEGSGFFTVQSKTDPNKTFYTRAGHFTVDSDGFLTTVNGDFVMGDLGKINTRQDPPPYSVNSDGELYSHPNGNTSLPGRLLDKIHITRFEDDKTLAKASETLFEETQFSEKLPNPGPNEAAGYKIHQGTVEQSNTNVIGELVNSISGLRLYEALQKNIHMQNESIGKAVNDVGRYRG